MGSRRIEGDIPLLFRMEIILIKKMISLGKMEYGGCVKRDY
ncbi:hypothetical protein BSM4216_1540 [Bacillus smithii]|nr:hypothetical protein BSM4216_1540 [Bacillus smithii]